MNNKIYKAGVVGLGNIGSVFKQLGQVNINNVLNHSQCYQLHPATELIGGVSPDKGDREIFSKTYSTNAYSELAEMLCVEKPDIISICSPTSVHYEQVKQCVDSGVSMIWLEKPATCNLIELNEIIEKCTSANTTVLVNYQRRYTAIYNKLRSVYMEKQLGNPLAINLTYSRGLEVNGSHIIDIAHYITGDMSSLSLIAMQSGAEIDNPSFICRVRESNIPVIVTGIDAPYHSIDISVSFEKGRFSILHGGMTAVWEDREEHKLYPGFYRLVTKDPDFLPPAEPAGCFASALDDLLLSYETKSNTRSNLLTACMTQLLIDEIRRA